jgi:hypothetical protein
VKGAVCRFAGTVGNSGRILVNLYDAAVHPAKTLMGLAVEDIPDDADGYVVHFGKVRGVNTAQTGWVEGDILFAAPGVPGGLTRVVPAAPNAIVTVAALITRSATVGEVFVRPTFAPSLSETQDVAISGVATDDVLQWDGSVWRNVQPPVGPQGPPGDAATVDVGTVTTVGPTVAPDVSNSGTTSVAVLDFDLPRAAAVSVGSTTTVGPADPAAVTDSGSDGDVVLDFAIPQGVAGEAGAPGEKGDTGDTGIVISPTEPDATDVLWADTSEVGDAVVPVGGTTGQSLVKASDADYDSEWATLELEPKAVPVADGGGKFFGIPGTFLGPSGTYGLGGTRPTADFGPFVVPYPIVINEIQYQTTAFSAGSDNITLQVSIYDADDEWQPIASTGRLISTVAETGTGITTVTGLSVTLPAGRYLTELVQSSSDRFATIRAYGVGTSGLAVMDLTTTPQNASRRITVRSAGTGGIKWDRMESPGFNGGGVAHAVLYKWSLV